LLLLSVHLDAQDTIHLQNPSFEDEPRKGTEFSPPIKEWRDCGLADFPSESPPDIHPAEKNSWTVTKEAQDGNTYIGLVVRFNGSFESVSQPLSNSLNEARCYTLSAYMAMSDSYKSMTSRSMQALENFIQPAVLNIWGGNETCARTELLAQSVPVENHEWMKYEFEFTPKADYSFITIEAFFTKNELKPYNGHILLDHLSPIIEVICK